MYTYSLFIDCIICISMQSDKEMAALGGSCYVRKPFIYKIRVRFTKTKLHRQKGYYKYSSVYIDQRKKLL